MVKASFFLNKDFLFLRGREGGDGGQLVVMYLSLPHLRPRPWPGPEVGLRPYRIYHMSKE